MIMELPKTGQFCWNELATHDIHKAKDFYSKLFGWEFEEIKSDDLTYTLILAGDKQAGGIWQISHNQQNTIPSHWMSYIYVDNVEKTLAHAIELGAKTVKGVSVAGDMGKLAIIQDPTGAQLAFWEPNLARDGD